MADVFISYAREDQVFVRRVFDALREFGRETWVDWDGIPPSAVWMAEVRKAIESGDAFVFVITPDSLASSVCREEVAHAASVNKRLIPILHRDVGETPAPEAVAERNWIFLRDGDDFDHGIELLLESLAADPEWIEQHTRLLIRARDWEQRNRPRSLLLRGDDLEGAERWLGSAAGREPAPTPLHAEFIVQSRRAATARQRLTLAGVGVALLVSVVLSVLALVQRSTAVRERERAEAEARTSRSRELAAEALGQIDIDPEVGVILALEAVDTSRTSEAEAALRSTLQASHLRATLTGHVSSVSDALYSADGTQVLSLGFDGTARLWDAATGEPNAVLEGHEGAISDGAFASDGTTVATAGEDETIRLWDVESGRELATLDGHESPVTAVSFSDAGDVLLSGDSSGEARLWAVPDGQLLAILDGHQGAIVDIAAGQPNLFATAGADGTVRLWDRSGEAIATLRGHGDAVTSVVFSADGTVLLSTSEDATARLWDVPGGRADIVLEGHTNDVVAGALSPDGSVVATAALDGTARLWDATTGLSTAVLPDHEGQGIYDVRFSPDGARVVTAGDDATARIWSATTGEQLAVLRGHTDEVLSSAFDPTGSRIATASGDSTAKIWDASGSTLAIYAGHRGWVYWATFDPQERRVATAGRDGTARVWDTDSGHQLLVVQPAPSPVTSVGFTPDGGIVTAGEYADVHLWDDESGELTMTLAGHMGLVSALSEVHPDGVRLLTGGDDGTARLWDLRSGETIAVLPHGPAQAIWVGPVIFSPDGTFAVTGTLRNDATVRIWDVTATEPTLRYELEGHEPGITSLELSADGTRLLTAGSDPTPRIWDPATGELLVTLRGDHIEGTLLGADLTPDAATALSWGNDGAARVWDARTGAELHVLRAPAGGVSWAALSDDGRLAAVGETTGVVRIWDARTGVELVELTGHAGLVFPLFNGDGTEVLTAGDDGTARLFSCELCVDLPDLIRLARDRVTRDLTEEERSAFGM